LEHCTQPRGHTSTRYKEADGSYRYYEYIRSVQLMVMCTLHGDMRCGEKLMNLYLSRLRLRKDLDTTTKKRRWKELELVINSVIQTDLSPPDLSPTAPEPALEPAPVEGAVPAPEPTPVDEAVPAVQLSTGGRPVLAADTEPGGLNIQESQEDFVRRTCTTDQDAEPLGLAEGHVESAFRLVPYTQKNIDFKMDCCIQHKMWEGLRQMLDCVFTASDCAMYPELLVEKLQWEALFRAHVDIWARLRVPGVMEAQRIDDLQFSMDSFCRLFVAQFGWNNLTNYIHNMMGGHFRYFLRRFGNLFEQSNIGLEANVKVIRTYVQRGTQHGGHCGNKFRKSKRARTALYAALGAVEVVEKEVAVGGRASAESLASAAQAHAEADTAFAALAAVPKKTRTKMNISRAVAAFCCNHIAAQLANLAEDNMAYML
ncbi:hypothetical protein B484DRAFT_439827, partial [Ochromonadaceae sp. CCMP2298]